MTPAELRDLAAVMRELGVFKLTVDGTTIEMSAAALAMGQSEALAKQGPAPKADETAPTPDVDEDDALTYAATEGGG